MKKTIYLFLSLLLISCSSDDSGSSTDNNNDDSTTDTFSITVTPSSTNVVVDEAFTVQLEANESFNELWVSTNNFAYGGYAIRDFGSSYTLHFNFDQVGSQTISIRAKSPDNVVVEKHIPITVSQGSAIKINGVQVVTFNGMNTSWDPEYPASNPNHLADLIFGFSKVRLSSYLDNDYGLQLWYRSDVLLNQGSMTWDCSSANLYVKPTATLKFGLADDEGDGSATDLIGVPYFKEINFSSYMATKPTTITYTFPESNLEFKVFVEWGD